MIHGAKNSPHNVIHRRCDWLPVRARARSCWEASCFLHVCGARVVRRSNFAPGFSQALTHSRPFVYILHLFVGGGNRFWGLAAVWLVSFHLVRGMALKRNGRELTDRRGQQNPACGCARGHTTFADGAAFGAAEPMRVCTGLKAVKMGLPAFCYLLPLHPCYF